MAFIAGRSQSNATDQYDYANRVVITLEAPAAVAGRLNRLYLIVSGRDGRPVAVLDGSGDGPVRLDRTGFKGEHRLGPRIQVPAPELERCMARWRLPLRAELKRRARALCQRLGASIGWKSNAGAADPYCFGSKLVITLEAPSDSFDRPRRLHLILSVEDGKPLAVLDGRRGWRGRTGFTGEHLHCMQLRVGALEYKRYMTEWGPTSRRGLERRAEELCRQNGLFLRWIAAEEAFSLCSDDDRELAAALWLLWEYGLAPFEVHSSRGVFTRFGPYRVMRDPEGHVTFECKDNVLASLCMGFLVEPRTADGLLWLSRELLNGRHPLSCGASVA